MTKKIILILAILSLVFLLRAWDDEELFKNTSTRLKPNVVILMDSSRSMNGIIFYPKYGVGGIPAGGDGDTDGDGFNSQSSYAGTLDSTTKDVIDSNGIESIPMTLNTAGWYGFVMVSSTSTAYFPDHQGSFITVTSATKLKVSQGTYDAWGDSSYFPGWVEGRTSGAYATVTARTSEPGNNYYLTVSDVQGMFTDDEVLFSFHKRTNGTFYPVYLYGTEESGYHVRYEDNYLVWLTIYATQTQLAQISHFGVYGTFDTTQTPSPTDPALNPSNCNCSGLTEVRRVFTRIQVAREVACKVLQDNHVGIRFGLYNFDAWTRQDQDPDGAFRLDPPNDSSELRNAQLKKKMYGMMGESNAPLAEALADIWRDFKPGPSGSKDYFVVNQKYSFNNSDYVQAYCQGNYCIIVTAGQSTSDTFAHHTTTDSVFVKYPIKRTGTYVIGQDWDYNNGWGDSDDTYDSNPGPASAARLYCPYETCWIRSASGNDWLDDVAYFASHQDMYPDKYYGTDVITGWPGDQNLITYTIGLNSDNDMLRRTADNGGGQYYTAANFEELTAAIQSVIDNIRLREDEMMFTTFAAPKQSFTYGKRGYIATFKPRNNKTIWQGQLKAYELEDNGDFKLNKPLWDAGRVLAARTPDSRLIYTVNKEGNLVLFDTTITPQDLDVYVDSDKDDANPLDPNEVRRNTVVDFIRGDNGYTELYNENDNTPADPSPVGYKIGDIFHFNPLVVSAPLIWKKDFEPTYNTFYENYKNRPEVIYVGSNDGMIHCFNVFDGSELWAFIPPSFLPRLKYLTPVTTAAERPYYFRYFVDGKGIVKDIQVQIDANNKEWKTVFIFGMGIGGKTYCALDITSPDPAVTGGGPKFLWELNDALLGCTEARPIIADIIKPGSGSETLAAVFLSGGVACDLTQVGTTKPVWEEKRADVQGGLQGQALFTLNADTGAVIHKLTYGTPGWDVTSKTRTISNLMYQVAAPPSLLDKNNDGVAEYLYFEETGSVKNTGSHYGGRLWRMNVRSLPVNQVSSWKPEKIYQAPPTQTLYLGTTLGFDKEKQLWALFGSGRRPDITDFSNPSGQFVALMDDFTIPAFPYTNTNLNDITTWFTTLPTDPSFSLTKYNGFFFNFEAYLHEIFYEPMPLLLNNTVFMNTFSPDKPEVDPTLTYLCSIPPITGYHEIYKFGFSASSNGITINGGYGTADSPIHTPGKILGYGLLSSGEFKVYTGGSTPGGFSISHSETITLDDIFGPVVWKENKK